MKASQLTISIILSGFLVQIACDQGSTLGPEPNIVPYSIVPYSLIPKPFSNATYFLYGHNLEPGEEAVIDQLQSGGFTIRDAWIPYEPGECMMAIIDQMIVRLEHPDPRIYLLGFVSDSTQIAPGVCIPTWKHYIFNM